MSLPADLFKNRSLDAAVGWFFENCAADALSPPAADFFAAFAAHVESAADRTDEARVRLDALRGIFSLSCEEPFRVTPEGQSDLSPPSGFAFTPEGHLALADDFNHRIQVYDHAGNLLSQFGEKGGSPGQLHYPKGLAADADGNIYVADSWNHRVQKFDRNGAPLAVFGGYGEESGQMNEPYDVHIDAAGNLVVVERYNHRIQFFRPDGTPLGSLGNRGAILEEQMAYLFETPDYLLSSPVFEFPTAVARDGRNHFYVADSGNHRIVKFDAQWRQIGAFGTHGKGPGQFQYPLSVAVDRGGRVYVADLNNNRIQAFTGQGLFLFAFTAAGPGALLRMPGLVRIDPQGRLYAGLTFDTRVPRLQTPELSADGLYGALTSLRSDDPEVFLAAGRYHAESGAAEEAFAAYARALDLRAREPVPARVEDDPRRRDTLELPLRLADSAPPSLASGKDEPFLLGLKIYRERLQAVREELLETYAEWDRVGQECSRKIILKDALLLADRDDPRVFDKEHYLLRKNDQTLFRKTRGLFYEYKLTADRFAEYASALFRAGVGDSVHRRCGEELREQIDLLCALIMRYIAGKEKIENELAGSFAAAASNAGQWEDFSVKRPVIQRAGILLRHLQVNLLMLLRALRSALPRHAAAPWLREILGRLFAVEPHCLALPGVLLRTQEDTGVRASHDLIVKDILDAWVLSGTAELPERVRQPAADDFASVAFATEELRAEDLLAFQWIEALPVRMTGKGLQCGRDIFPAGAAAADAEGWVRRLEEALRDEDSYEKKYEELLDQQTVLQRQRLELDAVMKQVDVRDKKAPIPVARKITAADFQLSLAGRMIATLEFNELTHLTRLFTGCALLSGAAAARALPQTQRLFAEIHRYRAALDARVMELMKRKKSVFFEKADLEKDLATLNQSFDPAAIAQAADVKERCFLAQWDYDRAETLLARVLRIRNLMAKLAEFIGGTPGGEARPVLRLRRAFGYDRPPLGSFMVPAGLTRTAAGELLVTDYCHHLVYRFTADGDYVSRFGGWGTAPGRFKFPSGLAADAAGNIYVVDATRNRRIQKFDGAGKFERLIGGAAEQTPGLPALALDGAGNLWAADTENHAFRVYAAADGRLLRTLGGPATLVRPVSVCCLPDGGFLASDHSESAIKQFDAGGNLVRDIKKSALACGEIYFIAVSPKHGVFATDTWSNRIFHLDANLQPVAVYGNSGRGAGELGMIGQLAVWDDSLAVAGYDMHRIQIFALA